MEEEGPLVQAQLVHRIHQEVVGVAEQSQQEVVVAEVRQRPDPVVEGVLLSWFLHIHSRVQSWGKAERSVCLRKNSLQGVTERVLLISTLNMG